MATYGTLQTRVQSNVIDLPVAVQGNVPIYINAVIEQAQTLWNFNCQKAEIQGYLTSSSTTSHLLLNTPQGWKEPRGTPYWAITPFTTINRMDWAPNRTYSWRQWNADSTSTTGAPTTLLLGENITVNSSGTVTASSAVISGTPIYVFPYSDGNGPGAGGQYPVYIPYWAILPDLVNTGDLNWFTTYMPEFIVAAATKMAFEMDWDDAGGQGGRAMYWHTQAWGPQFNGSDVRSAGGWFAAGYELDKRIGFAPIRVGT